jgi:hypothetical protein
LDFGLKISGNPGRRGHFARSLFQIAVKGGEEKWPIKHQGSQSNKIKERLTPQPIRHFAGATVLKKFFEA